MTIKYRLAFLPLMIALLCQCKKETVDKNCFDPKLLTEAEWYPDKNYNITNVQYYSKEGNVDYTSGKIYHAPPLNGNPYPVSWKFNCNKISFNGGRPKVDHTAQILSLTESTFQLDDGTLLYNPAGDSNGKITVKSDLGNFDLDKIVGVWNGVNTISKYESQSSIVLVRFSKDFPEVFVKIEVENIDLDTIKYPCYIANPNINYFLVKGFSTDTSNITLTLTQFKNDTLSGTFSTRMIKLPNVITTTTTSDTIINKGTFAIKMYKW